VACLVGLFLMIRLIRKPPSLSDPAESGVVGGDTQAGQSADPASLYSDQEIAGGRVSD
jgi:hypothetical protein